VRKSIHVSFGLAEHESRPVLPGIGVFKSQLDPWDGYLSPTESGNMVDVF
jgi:hypothetical protein